MQNPTEAAAEPSPGLVNTAIRAITQHIRSEGLAPGDPLPSEAAMTRQLNVSRTVVREAFRSLSAMRLIDMSAGRRATVAKLDTGAMSMVIEHGITTHQISVHQVYDVRRTIEMRTVGLAALRRTDAEAATIANAAKLMRESFKNPEIVMEHDIAFHEAIASASHNPVFSLIVTAFSGVTRRTWVIGWRTRSTPEDQLKMIKGHEDIADAIFKGDPRLAAEHMARHFDKSVKALLDAGIA
ncbi:FadR family transcriptional regulator [Mesorhizobium sp. BR1-1-9]|uniref:FadR/GntR family transcriptional regulator n=1 Tax=unclassified Mesorhizobium TaxID=325217 RepID=UPI00112E0E39|nr:MULTISPECIES: FadR/GntR family transcriptional regulator [unclassified Mesorhizobium]MBZ9811230.1 FadR family transcriptional regulator [Mesorhizobium sp. ESP-6-2]MBZ9870244.1 FadR family transcriptional regulator [Mesorhizobium sp. BR1-1-9]MBZ9942205.1 FadR family transcriptional regulator [Mesorhizobium sp. BR1-1-13]TPM25808.1 FadR family transcriptional regulator [Mesorhizobium sp. B2-2-2]